MMSARTSPALPLAMLSLVSCAGLAPRPDPVPDEQSPQATDWTDRASPPPGEVLPFQEQEMTRPVLLEGRDIVYPKEALAAGRRGQMKATCIIGTDGRVYSCRIIQSSPLMERAVLDSLYSRRYTPATYQGRPVNVTYVFSVHLRGSL